MSKIIRNLEIIETKTNFLDIRANGAIYVPRGRTTDRPEDLQFGAIRYNSEQKCLEVYVETNVGSDTWLQLSADYGFGTYVKRAGDEIEGAMTFNNDVMIKGSLQVLGSTTTVSSQNLIVEDPIIELGKNNNGAIQLLGLQVGTDPKSWWLWNRDTNRWFPAHGENTSSLTIGDIQAKKFYGDLEGTVLGDVGGNSSTATRWSNGLLLGINGTDGNHYGSISFDGSEGEVFLTLNTSFRETIQDYVGHMITDNIQQGLTITYNDTDGKLDFDLNDPVVTLSGPVSGSATIFNLSDTTLNTTVKNFDITLAGDVTGKMTVQNLNDVVINTLLTSSSVKDIVGSMVTGNYERGLSASYDMLNGKLNFATNDPIITINGAVAGSATMTNLSNTTINTVAKNFDISLAGDITGTASINNLNSATIFATLQGSTNPDFVECVQDIIGNMLIGSGSSQFGISVIYDDNTGKLGFKVNDPTISIAGAVVGSATMNNLGNTTINVSANPTITLSGDASGSITLNNLTSGTLMVTVLDDSHLHDARYYTKTQADANYINVIGDSMNGDLFFNTNARILNTNGSASAPSYSFDAAHGYGLYTDGTGLGLATNGVERINITDQGTIIRGNLTIEGSTTMVNSTDLEIQDNTILLNKAETGAGVTLGTSGIEIARGSLLNVSWVWDESNRWWGPMGNTALGNISTISSPSGVMRITGSGAVTLPLGSTAQRPTTPVVGMIRSNTTLNSLESFADSTWKTLAWDSSVMLLDGSQAMLGAMNTQSIIPVSNNTYDIGTASNRYANVYATNLSGTSVQARYADVAERYEADSIYEPGTVVVFGGEKEITVTNIIGDTRVAGVISTDPAIMMNSDAGDNITHPFVALVGRVPCKVKGKIRKGDMLTTSEIYGVATKAVEPKLGSIVGKALENYDAEIVGIIEISIQRS